MIADHICYVVIIHLPLRAQSTKLWAQTTGMRLSVFLLSLSNTCCASFPCIHRMNSLHPSSSRTHICIYIFFQFYLFLKTPPPCFLFTYCVLSSARISNLFFGTAKTTFAYPWLPFYLQSQRPIQLFILLIFFATKASVPSLWLAWSWIDSKPTSTTSLVDSSATRSRWTVLKQHQKLFPLKSAMLQCYVHRFDAVLAVTRE